MITISLCMIVKNEEDMIGKCLESVKEVVDEIIIVDTGSTDQTKKVVGQYTDKIYDFKWIDDFAAARNYSFSKATKEYILWLDADDVLLKDDVAKLGKLKESLDTNIDCVQFYYNYSFDEAGKPNLVFRRERLVKRNCNFKWVGFIHEYIGISGRIINEDIYVTHTRVHSLPERNITIYEKKLKEGVEFSPRDQYYYGKELYYHGRFEETIDALGKFITMPAWIEDKLDALYRIADCYHEKNDYKKAREYLFLCFEECAPRAECLFRIGKTFQDQQRYDEAIYWYNTIFNTNKPKDDTGFIFDEFWTWKPHLELCVCYSRTGDIKKSYYHNEEAAKYVPNAEPIRFNREYFKGIGYVEE